MGIQINGQTDTISAFDSNFSLAGNVSIGGTLTYEDVTSVDSVGIITAQSGIRVTGGNVGIGTDTSGSTKLKIESGSGARAISLNAPTNGTYITFETAGTAYADIGAEKGVVGSGSADAPVINARGSRDISFRTNSSERLRITSAGDVGIGTDNPATTLHLVSSGGAATGNEGIRLQTSQATGGNWISFNDTSRKGYFGYKETSDDGIYLVNEENSHIVLGTNGLERLRIRSQGSHLLLGTGGDATYNEITETSSNVGLVIGSGSVGNGGIAIRTGTSGTGRIYFADNSGNDAGRNRGQINYYHDGDYMMFATTSTERLRITSDGAILAGSTTSSSIDGGFTNLQLWKDSATEGGSLTLVNNQASTASGTCSISVFQNYRNAGEIVFGRENANNWQSSAGSAASNIIFKTNSAGTHAERLRITSAGDVQARRTRSNTAGDVALSIQPSDSTIHYGFRIDSANNNLNLDRVGTGNFVTVSNNGSVGINESSPNRRLYISGSESTTYSSTSGSNNAYLRLHNKNGTDNSGVDNHVGIEFYVADGATTVGMLSMERTGNNIGDFTYKTRTGAGSYAEYFRISSDGMMGLGTNSPTNTHGKGLHIADTNAGIRIQNTVNTGWAYMEYVDETNTVKYTQGYRDATGLYGIRPGNSLVPETGITMTSAGNVGVNDDTGGWAENFQVTSNPSHNQYGIAIKIQSSSGYLMRFANNIAASTVICGSVSGGNGNSTSFNTSWSDSRRKKNFETWNEEVLPLFKSLEPKKFNFTHEDDGTVKTKGYVAQDNVDKFPEAYPSLDDTEVDEKRYMFNPSGMVIYLMKALQEEIAKREALEQRLTDAGL